MKKFFTSVPYQKSGELIKAIYRPVGNAKLVYEKAHSLPILNAVNNFTEKGEEIEVIFIIGENENIKKNLGSVESFLDELVLERELKCRKKYIYYRDSDDITVMLELYGNLIRCCDDDDEIYSCITYGTKPVPIVQMMAMRYAFHVKKNVYIGMIVYGKAHGNKQNEDSEKIFDIYDMTSLFYIDDLSEKFSRMAVKDPEKILESLIFGQEGENDEDLE